MPHGNTTISHKQLKHRWNFLTKIMKKTNRGSPPGFIKEGEIIKTRRFSNPAESKVTNNRVSRSIGSACLRVQSMVYRSLKAVDIRAVYTKFTDTPVPGVFRVGGPVFLGLFGRPAPKRTERFIGGHS